MRTQGGLKVYEDGALQLWQEVCDYLKNAESCKKWRETLKKLPKNGYTAHFRQNY
jgi:hypothetical protein